MARDSDEHIVIPEGWLSRGEAFVRAPDGRGQLAVFGGIPGERGRVKMLSRGGHQDRARFVGPIGAPDPTRVTPPCERYAPCGRCPLMHMNTVGQSRARITLLDAAFTAARVPVGTLAQGRPSPLVQDGDAGVAHTLELIAGWSDERHPRIGVAGRDGRRVVPIPHCLLVTPSLRALMSATAHHVHALEVWPWEKGRGSLRGLLARQSVLTGEMLATLVFSRANPKAEDLAEAIAAQVPGLTGIVVHWNDEPGPLVSRDPVTGEADASPLYGRPFLEEAVDGVRVRLGGFDPYPTHPRLGTRVWMDVVEALAPVAGDAVVHLGSGVGALTLLLARRSGWALGVDPRDNVVRRARENATANGIVAEFVAAPAAEALASARDRLAGRRPLIVAELGNKNLDDATIDEIVALRPRRVVLTAANPRALGTDTARLVAHGLPLRRLIPYDTAPFSPFGDTVAVLTSDDLAPPTLRAPRRKAIRA